MPSITYILLSTMKLRRFIQVHLNTDSQKSYVIVYLCITLILFYMSKNTEVIVIRLNATQNIKSIFNRQRLQHSVQLSSGFYCVQAILLDSRENILVDIKPYII